MPMQRRPVRNGSLDLAITMLVTPIAQLCLYGRHATAALIVLVTGWVLALDYACGPIVRWRLPALVPPAPGHPHWYAALVTAGPRLLGLLSVYGLQMLCYGAVATPRRALGLPLALYGLMVLRQKWQEATLEVSLDFTVSILVNLGGQRLIYGALASAEVMTSFTSVFLPLAYGRRLATRLGFQALSVRWRLQPWWLSVLEVGCDTLLALAMAYGLQVVWYGAAATLERAGSLTVALYAFTMLRRYLFRRIFEGRRNG